MIIRKIDEAKIEEIKSNDIVKRLEGEDERDYTLFVDWLASNSSITKFHKDNNLDISISLLYKISKVNNWINRRALYREYQQLQNVNQNQYFLELNSTEPLVNLVNLNKELSNQALNQLKNIKNGKDIKGNTKVLKDIVATLNDSIRLSRLLANKSDNNLLVENLITQNNMNESTSNKIYEDYQAILDEEE